jgi:hypothetical protein
VNLLGLRALVQRHATGTYVVQRQAARSYDANGRLAAESPGTFPIDAHVQTNGRQADQVEDGTAQVVESITLFTASRLLSAGPPGQEADVITYQGRDYQVTEVRDWGTLGGFYKATAELI